MSTATPFAIADPVNFPDTDVLVRSRVNSTAAFYVYSERGEERRFAMSVEYLAIQFAKLIANVRGWSYITDSHDNVLWDSRSVEGN